MADMTEPAILFITRKWAPATGGMETFCLRLTEALTRSQPVETIALAGRENGMPPSALSLMLFPFTVIARILKRQAPAQIVHLGDMAIWPLGLLFGRGSRLVISAHGTDVAYHRRAGVTGALYGAYLRLGAKLLPRARVIANSRATADVLGETGWKAAATIALATDFTAPEKASPRHDTILFAGRLTKRKGCGWFIANVLPLLPKGMKLVIAGTRWDAEESQALDNPRVEFLGPQNAAELSRLYASSLCVIVPNIAIASREYEGFGLVAPEAASCGGVVLAAKCDGLLDAVLDGETGFHLESGNAQIWAEKIAEIAGWSPQKRGDFTSAAQAKAREFYNWDRVADQYLAAYSEDLT